MKKQECTLFVVSLIVLLLVWVMNGNRASAAEYNFFFYGDQNSEKEKQNDEIKLPQSPQETSSLESATANTNESPQHKETAIEKTAAVITPPPVRTPRRFLSSVFRSLSIPNDAYLSMGWEFNGYIDKKSVEDFKDEVNSLSMKTKILPHFGLEASIPLEFYNPGLRIFKGGAFSEWEPPRIGKASDEYLKPWHDLWNYFQAATAPAIHMSTGLLYNSRHSYEEHLWRKGMKKYTDIKIHREEAAASLSKHSWYVGGGIRFRLFKVVDLTASLNVIPTRKASRLFSGGASIVF